MVWREAEVSEYYHIYISPRQGVTREQIESVLNNAVDWYRYDPKSWIVYTTSDARKWYSRLQSFVEPGGHILICKLNVSDHWGLMPKGLWEWIKGPKGKDRGV
jgi:hypothetical protein